MSKNNGAELQLSKKGSMMHYRRLATPYLLLAPMLAFVMCFMIWPIINVFMMSTESYKVTKPNDRHFIGLENFVTVFTKDQIFLKTLGNTAVYVILSVVFQTVLGFWLAWLLTRKFKGRGVIRALALVPWAVAGLMVGIIWNLMLGQTYGVINDLLRRAGIIEMNISWFSSGNSAMLAAVIANIWRGIPFFTISYMSALSGISDDLYESAKIDGANSAVTLFRITLPMIKDTIIFTTLLRAIWTFNAVDLIVSLTDGGPNRGTTVILVLSPWHPYLYGYLLTEPEMHKGFFQVENWLRQYCADNNIPLYGSYDPACIEGLQETDFFDGLHCGGTGIARFFPGIPQALADLQNGTLANPLDVHPRTSLEDPNAQPAEGETPDGETPTQEG